MDKKTETEDEDTADSMDFEALLDTSLSILKKESRKGKPYAEKIRAELKKIMEGEGDSKRATGAQVPSPEPNLTSKPGTLVSPREAVKAAFEAEMLPYLRAKFGRVNA